jgi:BNR repeat-like domain/RTX calcium-binding nonapeptide repeat (4 copies)
MALLLVGVASSTFYASPSMPVRAARVTPALAALVALAALGAARAAELTGTEGPDRLLGTPLADTIRGRGGNDRLEGGAGSDLLHGGAGRDALFGQAGADRVAAQADGARDAVSCGAGQDVVNAELVDVVGDDCEIVTRQLSRDPFDGAQHETQVEPDSFAFGRTIVTVFQSGRLVDGGAVATGWATSVDGGSSWRAGFLERVGERVSDPVVAYDPLHGVWLIATLGAGEGSTQLLVSRSRDGLAWSRPAPAAADAAEEYDKEWIACDTWPTSPLRGRCYLAYLELRTREIRTRHSSDGGVTWSSPVPLPVASPALSGNGAFPIVRPDGTLLVAFSVYGSLDPADDSILVARSTDGGLTFATAARAAQLFSENIPAVRAPAFVSAEVDAAGTVYLAWADCRFSAQCTTNGIVVATSRDGIAWSTPRRVPFAPVGAARDWVVPAVAVDTTTSGARARLAVAAYSVTPPQGCPSCQVVDAYLVRSSDGGRRWRPPVRLNAESVPLDWVADTGLGRMFGDYISTSFVGGRPVPVLSLADAPFGGELRQAIFASTRVP